MRYRLFTWRVVFAWVLFVPLKTLDPGKGRLVPRGRSDWEISITPRWDRRPEGALDLSCRGVSQHLCRILISALRPRAPWTEIEPHTRPDPWIAESRRGTFGEWPFIVTSLRISFHSWFHWGINQVRKRKCLLVIVCTSSIHHISSSVCLPKTSTLTFHEKSNFVKIPEKVKNLGDQYFR